MTGDRPVDRYASARQVIDLLEGELVAEGYELIDVRVFSGGGRQQVRVYLDTAEGIDLDACARASRSIGLLLEEADIFAGRYVVEVSSPGIRRPLRTAAHFAGAVDQDVDLVLRRAGKREQLRGRLVGVENDRLSVRPANVAPISPDTEGVAENANEIRVVDRQDVLEANLEPDFDVQALIGADRKRRKEEKRRRRQQRRQKPRG